MATIREVTKGRPDHSFLPLDDDLPMLEAAKCECGAKWRLADDPLITFCEWADRHQAPSCGESR